ncbi:dihydrofolate reductase [Bacteroidia bacterium]|jgi:dipeptidyl-peptidase-3|nr:dihydrofolate reductase [Bacteroidia bacterium]|tara:strand:+ start:1352 stop:3430 length:2079 start_codon:yes stop_codon:yes gene_type:complete
MKKTAIVLGLSLLYFIPSFGQGVNEASNNKKNKGLEVAIQRNEEVNRFADLKILKYDASSINDLTTQQKELVYYLSQAALSGREITYAQNYKHNIFIKRTLEEIYTQYQGDRQFPEFLKFEEYLKRFWFSNGIHHHYAEKKFTPEFDPVYLIQMVNETQNIKLPLEAEETKDQFAERFIKLIFDPNLDAKKVVKDKGVDKVAISANNFYGEGVGEEEAIAHYGAMATAGDKTPVEYGLNSRLVKQDGKLVDLVYKSGGLYGGAMDQMIFWLEKAKKVAENKAQAEHIGMLIEYFRTGDLKQWDKTNIKWVGSTDGDIDFILGFIEVYGDAIGYKGAYEAIIQVNDKEASKRMEVLSLNAQYFEDNSSIQKEHKKENVVGVSYRVINAAMEAGDAAPATPIGVNLPNSNWIRSTHGSKSISLGNIVEAYNSAGGSSSLKEFYLDEKVRDRIKEHGKLSSKMHTAMHEVIGHASGKINPGIGTPKETLKNYSNTLEEARADLVALYYIYDTKLIDLGLMPSLEVGMAEYDSYISNGMMLQLRRLDVGENIEEDHMRNRQLNASWAYEKGLKNNVIEKKVVDGKTYFVVNDYAKLRVTFGDLLKEIQRIKSEGDYAAAEALVEGYGVKVDQALHAEVIQRYESLQLAPYSGFVQPKLVPSFDKKGKFVNLKVEEEGYVEQMLRFAKEYPFVEIGE